MITLSEKAQQHIASLLRTGDAFRLSVKETGCSGYMYQPEIVSAPKKPTDVHLTVSGVPVYIDADSAAILKDTRIDFVKKSFGFEQLVFHNPNAEGLCGCGESFKLKK